MRPGAYYDDLLPLSFILQCGNCYGIVNTAFTFVPVPLGAMTCGHGRHIRFTGVTGFYY